MRARFALRLIVAAIGLVLCLLPVAQAADPSPAPTPAPGGGGGGGGGGAPRPVQPVALPDGAAGSEFLEATGERTRRATTTAAEPPVTTAAEPVAPPPTTTAPETEPAPVTPAPEPVATVPTPAPVTPVDVATDGEGAVSVPRDGVILLVLVLLAGIVVALRAIRAHERRIGWALLAFCGLYLLTLAGLVSGVASAATMNPVNFAATPGDGAVLLTFEPPPPGAALVVRRAPDGLAPISCDVGAVVAVTAPASGQHADEDLVNGVTYGYRACLGDGVGMSDGVTALATPVSGLDIVPPARVSRVTIQRSLKAVSLRWAKPADADLASIVVVRKLGSAPRDVADGVVVHDGDATRVVDHPFSTVPVHYAIFARDEDGNDSPAVRASVSSFDPPLRLPFDGQVTSNRPIFTWRGNRAFDSYVVRVFRADRCCRARQVVRTGRTTATDWRGSKLARGRYVWFVFGHPVGGDAKALRRLNTSRWRFRIR